MLIDFHFHLDKYQEYDKIYEQIVGSNNRYLCVTNSIENYIDCKAYFKENKNVKFALGHHPMERKKLDIVAFDRYAISTKYIGEIGLDRRGKNLDSQIQNLNLILNVLCNKGKIFSIHCYKMENELYSILTKYSDEKLILHWYNGDIDFIDKFITIGCYFSVNLAMLSSTNGRNILQHIPIDKLLIESDGPYTKVLGKKYEPLNLNEIYKCISAFYNIDYDNFVMQVYYNAKKILI